MFQVRWTESATREFLEVTTSVDPLDQTTLLAAIDDVEQLLRDDALSAGESRDDGERIIVDRLLTVRFAVDAKSLVVRITRVIVHRLRL